MKGCLKVLSQKLLSLRICKWNFSNSDIADRNIDSLLEKYGIEIHSDSSSVSALDSETEEEAELIEINFKIEEMRRVCSVVTLL